MVNQGNYARPSCHTKEFRKKQYSLWRPAQISKIQDHIIGIETDTFHKQPLAKALQTRISAYALCQRLNLCIKKLIKLRPDIVTLLVQPPMY